MKNTRKKQEKIYLRVEVLSNAKDSHTDGNTPRFSRFFRRITVLACKEDTLVNVALTEVTCLRAITGILKRGMHIQDSLQVFAITEILTLCPHRRVD